MIDVLLCAYFYQSLFFHPLSIFFYNIFALNKFNRNINLLICKEKKVYIWLFYIWFVISRLSFPPLSFQFFFLLFFLSVIISNNVFQIFTQSFPLIFFDRLEIKLTFSYTTVLFILFVKFVINWQSVCWYLFHLISISL